MPATTTELAPLPQARTAIAAVSTVRDAKVLRDQAEAVRAYAKQIGLGLDRQNEAAELKLRSERKAGELLASMPGKGARGGNRKSNDIVSLEDLGVRPQQSVRWQRIAGIPGDDFESIITTTIDAGKELTTAGALRLAAKLRADADPPVEQPPYADMLKAQDDLRAAVERIAKRWPEGFERGLVAMLRVLAAENEEPEDEDDGDVVKAEIRPLKEQHSQARMRVDKTIALDMYVDWLATQFSAWLHTRGTPDPADIAVQSAESKESHRCAVAILRREFEALIGPIEAGLK